MTPMSPIQANHPVGGAANEPDATPVRLWRSLRPQGASWKSSRQYSTLSVALLNSPLAVAASDPLSSI